MIAGVNEWGIRAARALEDMVALARIHAMQGRIFNQLYLLDRAALALAEAGRLLAAIEHPRLHSSVLELHGRLAEATNWNAGDHRFDEYLAKPGVGQSVITMLAD